MVTMTRLPSYHLELQKRWLQEQVLGRNPTVDVQEVYPILYVNFSLLGGHQVVYPSFTKTHGTC